MAARPSLAAGFLVCRELQQPVIRSNGMSKTDKAAEFIEILNHLIPKYLESSTKILLGADNKREIVYLVYAILKRYYLSGSMQHAAKVIKGSGAADVKLLLSISDEFLSKPINKDLTAMVVLRANLLLYGKLTGRAYQDVDYKALAKLSEELAAGSLSGDLPLGFFSSRRTNAWLMTINEDLNYKRKLGKTLQPIDVSRLNIGTVRRQLKSLDYII